MLRRRHLLAAPALLAVPAAMPAQAQPAWPSRAPIRLVVGFPPGGFSDFVARLLPQPMGASLGGATLVVENRPGAGATVGADHVAKSPPDGYTFFVTHVSPHGTAPGVFPQLPYDVVNDFTHLSMVCDTPTAIMVRRDSPLRSMADLLAAIRGPGLRFGTSGVGSIGHLQGELLQRLAGATRYEHVPYRGTAPALQDLLGGTIETVFDPLAGQITQVTGNGPMRVLAISAPARIAALPEVPTLNELGFAEATATAWMGLSGPRNLPAPIASRMTEAVLAAIARPDVRARLDELTCFPPAQPMVGDAFAAFIREFSTKWMAVARAANIVAS